MRAFGTQAFPRIGHVRPTHASLRRALSPYNIAMHHFQRNALHTPAHVRGKALPRGYFSAVTPP
ncbi:MAG: hypothetical protein C0492_05655 [Verminephrobacter sp.]|nr:hypothetical protein [Verminephrobacter sp.]